VAVVAHLAIRKELVELVVAVRVLKELDLLLKQEMELPIPAGAGAVRVVTQQLVSIVRVVMAVQELLLFVILWHKEITWRILQK
jgi:hypothetical protein